MRKLASVQIIKKVETIPKADRVELAKVLGWDTIVQKGQFKEGEKIVFVEIDSILPDRPEFEFMRKMKFRVRTMKSPRLGVISQGIVFPIDILPDGTYEIEDDVTEILGITKFEPQIPANLSGLVKGSFPSFIPKTDETRIQVLQPVLTKYKGTGCFITEKLDGTSFTCFLKDGEFGVCSRNLELIETEENVYWKQARLLKLEEKLRSIGKNICIQGELIGQGLAKNYLEIEGHDIYFFNVFDIDNYKYYDFEEYVKFFKDIELKTVPILETHYILEDSIDVLVEKAKGRSVLCPRKDREGIVIRPLKEIIDMQMSQGFANGRLSFKSVNQEYLVDNE